MKHIVSFSLSKNEELREITILKDARILSVCVIKENLLLFVEEDVNANYQKTEREKLEIAVIKDGRCFYTDDYQFLGTVVLDFGNAVYHVLYRKI